MSIKTPSSVIVSWLPTNKDNWNGAVQNYTVDYKLLQSADNASAVESSGMGPFFMGSVSIPNNKQGLVNNPDPKQVTLPLERESVEVQNLHEHHIYQFTVYYENRNGISEPSFAVTQETSVSGMYLLILLSNMHNYELTSIGTYAAPSGPPLHVSAVPVSDSAILITWEPPSLFERNGVITGYQINVTKVEDGKRKEYVVSTSEFTNLSVQIKGTKSVTFKAVHLFIFLS